MVSGAPIINLRMFLGLCGNVKRIVYSLSRTGVALLDSYICLLGNRMLPVLFTAVLLIRALLAAVHATQPECQKMKRGLTLQCIT